MPKWMQHSGYQSSQIYWAPFKKQLLARNLNENFAVENVSTSLKLGSGINKLWFGFQI